MRDALLGFLTCALVLLSGAYAHADEGGTAAVGEDAPEITATTWLNTEDGESPLEGDADPKLIVLEFWGTWCGPCVRSMPKVQRLWETYRDHRVLVVAITREKPGEVRAFLKEHGYSMPIACDPAQSCIAQYHIPSWPTTVLIDRDGKILWRGGPYSVEAEVEKALGLESSPTTLLGLYFDACTAGDKAAVRAPLERLVEKAPAAFDLRSFAEGILGGPPTPDDAASKPLSAKAALKLLTQIQKAWSDEAKRQPLLTQLAAAEVEPVDLKTWAGARFRKAYPFKSAELKDLLAAKKYGAIVEMFVMRQPSGSLYKTAAKDAGLVAYCDKTSSDTWTFARKAKMARMYWMSEEAQPEDFDSEAFSRDISVSGLMMNAERNRVTGILIGGDAVMRDGADAYVIRQLSRFYVMNAIAAGQSLKPAKLDKKVKSESGKIEKALRSKYG